MEWISVLLEQTRYSCPRDALLIACEHNRSSVVRYLLSHHRDSLDPSTVSKIGFNCVQIACAGNHEHILRMLIAFSFYDVKLSKCPHPILLAAQSCNLECIPLLLDHGFELPDRHCWRTSSVSAETCRYFALKSPECFATNCSESAEQWKSTFADFAFFYAHTFSWKSRLLIDSIKPV